MEQVLKAFAIFLGGLILIVILNFFGVLYYTLFIVDHTPKKPNPPPAVITQNTSAAPAAAPATPAPAAAPDVAIDLNRYTGTQAERLAKAMRDQENGGFSDAPVTAGQQMPLPIIEQKKGNLATQNASVTCTTRMAWQIVATKLDPVTQKEQQSYLGKLCLDYAPGSTQTLIGESHWSCCPVARTDGVVGMIQGNAILLDRQLAGGAQRYTGTAVKTPQQVLGQAMLQGTWAGKNDAANVQGTWVATPLPSQAATN